MTAARRWDVVGMGNALVDVVGYASERFLERHGLAKGTMTLIGERQAEELYADMEPVVQCSGGSVANTMVGLASLGAAGTYLGKVRDDSLGTVFTEDIRAAGVAFEVRPAGAGPATGRCLILVTPDAQRTMLTFLGASATLSPDDVDPDTIRSAGIVYLEGYLWDPLPGRQAFLEAADIAHRAGCKVALSLSDSLCVERHRQQFCDLLGDQVDIVFANEQEAVSLVREDSLDQALDKLSACCRLAAVTLGGRGSVVVAGKKVIAVPAAAVSRVVDTTGAGDLYASGFLFGLSRGLDVHACARLGSATAAEIIGRFGARPGAPLCDLVDS